MNTQSESYKVKVGIATFRLNECDDTKQVSERIASKAADHLINRFR
jgi:hypothetical protein